MRRPIFIFSLAISLVLASAMASLPVRAAAVPPLRADLVQDESGLLAPADRQAIASALSAYGPEKYKILLVSAGAVSDIDTFLDRVWSEWKLSPETILLLLTLGEGNRIRFYLGSGVSSWGVTPERVIADIRGVYSSEMAAGRVAPAIVALAEAIHSQIPNGTMAPISKGAGPTSNGGGAPSWWSRARMSEWKLSDIQFPDWAPYPIGAAGLTLLVISVTHYRRRLHRWRQEVAQRCSEASGWEQ